MVRGDTDILSDILSDIMLALLDFFIFCQQQSHHRFVGLCPLRQLRCRPVIIVPSLPDDVGTTTR